MTNDLNDFYLLKQNEQYFSIRPEFYKNNKYNPLDLFGVVKPNKNDFEEFGFDNIEDCKNIIKDVTIKGKDIGVLDSGRCFELELSPSFKNIITQPIIEEIDAVDRIVDKSFMKWYSSWGQTINMDLQPDFYTCFYLVKHPDGGRDTIVTDGTFSYIDGTTSSTLNMYKICNKISFNSGSYTAITGVGLKRTEPIFYLIQYNSQLYTFDGTEILLTTNQTITDENFINNGITDLTTLGKEIWDSKFPLKTGLKILAFTNINKTDIELSCAITPYKPIDKFNKFQIMIKR